ERPYERRLSRLLRLGGVARQPNTQPPHLGKVAPVELAERVLVAAPHGADEAGVVDSPERCGHLLCSRCAPGGISVVGTGSPAPAASVRHGKTSTPPLPVPPGTDRLSGINARPRP